MTTVTLEHVSKQFRDSTTAAVRAVQDVSLKIAPRETLAIVGPSGCGKTTLLRLIAGLETPNSGRVLYDHQPVSEIPLMQRNIGMVFQHGALIPHWQAGQNVGFFLWLRHREKEVPERVRRIAQITGFGLEKLLTRKTSQLSGGEQQRIGIARALTRDLNVLLLDEPFANLDAKFRMAARYELKRLLHEFPVTSVYVTHDQHEAIALAQRIAVMRDGHLEQVGSYAQLYESPINLFIATFIGTPPINLFAGRSVGASWAGENLGGYRIRGDLPEGTPLTLGVRPEHWVLDAAGVSCLVELVTPLYAERQQMVTVGAGRERWTLLLPLTPAVRVGETLRCAPLREHMLFFDSASGLRVA
ncbi:MAG: ABC transporter ATP-binding protein [Chloroflexi bacterium]|nr:ABC transporter ATP-binding protein [Chloroflexota bacterium]